MESGCRAKRSAENTPASARAGGVASAPGHHLSTVDGRSFGGLQVDGLSPANADASWRLDRVHRDLGALRVPGLVNVIDQLVHGDQVWLITDVAPFPTVTHMRTGGVPMPSDVALVVATDTAEILRRLHAAGQAHGDLGPHNVIVTAGGGVLVAETGLAHALAATVPGPGHDTAAWALMVADLADTTTDRRVEDLLRQAAQQVSVPGGAGLAAALATLGAAAGSVNRDTVRAVSTAAATIAIPPPVSPVAQLCRPSPRRPPTVRSRWRRRPATGAAADGGDPAAHPPSRSSAADLTVVVSSPSTR